MLIFVISYGFIIKSSVIIKYQLDKSEFIKNCINLNKPEKKCEGKCHLNAQLNDAENKPLQESLPTSITNFEIPYFTVQTQNILNFNLIFNFKNKIKYSNPLKLSIGYPNTPFHPPIF